MITEMKIRQYLESGISTPVFGEHVRMDDSDGFWLNGEESEMGDEFVERVFRWRVLIRRIDAFVSSFFRYQEQVKIGLGYPAGFALALTGYLAVFFVEQYCFTFTITRCTLMDTTTTAAKRIRKQ